MQIYHILLSWMRHAAFIWHSGLTAVASTGQRWWWQTHSALHLNGGVWVQPFSSPLVSLAPFSPPVLVLLSQCCCPCSGRKECRSSRARRTPWRSSEPCRRRRRNSRSPKRDLPLSPCWRWSGGSWNHATRSRSSWRIEFVTQAWRVCSYMYLKSHSVAALMKSLHI